MIHNHNRGRTEGPEGYNFRSRRGRGCDSRRLQEHGNVRIKPERPWTDEEIVVQRAEALNRLCTENRLTQKEIAEQTGVCDRRITDLHKLPGWDSAVADWVIDLLPSEIPDVIRAMVREAKKGNVQAAKIILQAAGILNQDGVIVKTETHVHNDNGGRTLAPEDVFRRLAAQNGGGVDRLVRRLSDGREN